MADRTSTRCSKCARAMVWGGKGNKICGVCRKDGATPIVDYAERAAAQVERDMGRPRRTWQAGGDEHRAVVWLLKRWAKERGAEIGHADMRRMKGARNRKRGEAA